MLEHIERQEESWPKRNAYSLSDIQPLIARLCQVSLEELIGKGGGPRVMFARQTAMYLMHVVYGFSLTQIAASFGRDRSLASQACHRIEDLRDDPGFDHKMTQLEDLLRSAGANRGTP